MNQGDKLNETSFIALVCDKDDLLEKIQEEIESKNPELLAQKCIDSDWFRKKFTETIMEDFLLTCSAMLDRIQELTPEEKLRTLGIEEI